MWWGLICGFCAAFFQDAGYIFSRRYVLHDGKPETLLIHSQILTGCVSLLILGCLFLFGYPVSWKFLLSMFWVILGSGGGQYYFFQAEKTMNSSVIASMMGLRVVLLAVVSAVFLHAHYHWIQWGAIFLAAFSAFLLNWDGRHWNFSGMKAIGLSLLFYCISDLHVAHMVHGIGTGSLLLNSLYALCGVNIVTGLLLSPFNPGGWHWTAFQRTVPFSGSWIIKQVSLYLCYALIGPVHGNMVLSIRGPLAILIDLFRYKGHLPGDSREWCRRSIAALLMTGAIILYSLFR